MYRGEAPFSRSYISQPLPKAPPPLTTLGVRNAPRRCNTPRLGAGKNVASFEGSYDRSPDLIHFILDGFKSIIRMISCLIVFGLINSSEAEHSSADSPLYFSFKTPWGKAPRDVSRMFDLHIQVHLPSNTLCAVSKIGSSDDAHYHVHMSFESTTFEHRQST